MWSRNLWLYISIAWENFLLLLIPVSLPYFFLFSIKRKKNHIRANSYLSRKLRPLVCSSFGKSKCHVYLKRNTFYYITFYFTSVLIVFVVMTKEIFAINLNIFAVTLVNYWACRIMHLVFNYSSYVHVNGTWIILLLHLSRFYM